MDKHCWCPCGCGCPDDENAPCGRLLSDGLCSECAKGRHEVPPADVKPGVEELMRLHLEIAAYYAERLKMRKEESGRPAGEH